MGLDWLTLRSARIEAATFISAQSPETSSARGAITCSAPQRVAVTHWLKRFVPPAAVPASYILVKHAMNQLKNINGRKSWAQIPWYTVVGLCECSICVNIGRQWIELSIWWKQEYIQISSGSNGGTGEAPPSTPEAQFCLIPCSFRRPRIWVGAPREILDVSLQILPIGGAEDDRPASPHPP